MKRRILVYLFFSLTILFHSQTASAAELVTNGGFESGSFSGWTATNCASGEWKPWQIGVTGSTTNDGGYVPVPTSIVVQQGTRVAFHGVTCGAGQSHILAQDVTIPVGSFVRMTWIDRYQMNHSQFCTTTCGTATYAVEIRNTSNVLLQTLYTVTTPTNTNSNTGYVNHSADLTAYQGQTIRLRFVTTVTVTLAGPGQLEVDAVSVQPLQPTAAGVTIGGRVLTSAGTGVSRASLTLADSTGSVRTAITNAFGYYGFTDIPAGETYVLTVSSKRYLFPGSPRALNVVDDLSDVNFVASP